MQCLVSNCCCMSPKFAFLILGISGSGLGILSAVWPARSIGLYQSIMERFNWKVVPIDLAREIRNTRILGMILAALSLAIFSITIAHC